MTSLWFELLPAVVCCWLRSKQPDTADPYALAQPPSLALASGPEGGGTEGQGLSCWQLLTTRSVPSFPPRLLHPHLPAWGSP